MNTNPNNIVRTNRTIVTVLVAAITLGLGVVIGVTAESGNHGSSSSTSPATNTKLSTVANATSVGPNQWNPFQEIRNMQSQMDRMFSQMNQQFQSTPALSGFADVPGYSLTTDVRDLKDHYEVHAYLPDANASDVNVSVKNNRTLDVRVNSHETVNSGKQNATSTVAEWGQYQQEIQLPTPVKADQMKITHQGHDLIITVPKATQ